MIETSRWHELKIWPKFFNDVCDGSKPFEVRINDRDFQMGDRLFLREWDPREKMHTGRSCEVVVTYIIRGSDEPLYLIIPSNVCVMGIELVNGPHENC